jgi:hypothetical protein
LGVDAMKDTVVVVRDYYLSLSEHDRLRIVKNNLVQLLARKCLDESSIKHYISEDDAIKIKIEAETLLIS